MSRAEAQKGKTSHTGTFLVSAYFTPTNISLAKATHVASPKSRGKKYATLLRPRTVTEHWSGHISVLSNRAGVVSNHAMSLTWLVSL